MADFWGIRRETDSLAASLGQARAELAGFTLDAEGQLTDTQKILGETTKATNGLAGALSSALGRAFDGAVVKGNSFASVLQGLGQSLSKSVLGAAFSPIQGALSSGVNNLLGDGFSSLASLLPFAKGGVFSNGRVQAFAKGGVVGSPTTFPMRGGGTGLMGEAGPEAIMPLARGADGRLGVAASGGGRSSPSVVVNISTPDIESFRRSTGQISASLARAVDRGRGHQ